MNLDKLKKTLLLSLSLLVCVAATETIAQGPSVSIPQPSYVVDWNERLAPSLGLKAHDHNLLGDNIDLLTGALSFEHVDVAIPGNSELPVELRRRLNPSQLYNNEFADWQLAVPSISTKIMQMEFKSGQRWGKARCSQPLHSSIPDAQFPYLLSFKEGTPSSPGMYSDGVLLDVPGRSFEQLLDKTVTGSWPEQAKKVTKNGWYFTCIDNIDGAGTEGFYGYAPNGDRYTFNVIRSRNAVSQAFAHHISREVLSVGGVAQTSYKHRYGTDEAYYDVLAASEVQDKNGNWVKYNYDSSRRLTKIYSNDGRAIDINYSGTISSVVVNQGTADQRQWLYSYSTGLVWGYRASGIINGSSETVGTYENRLKTVTLPDGRGWEFNLEGLFAPPVPGVLCKQIKQKVSLTHPDGITGHFELEEFRRLVIVATSQYAPDCPNTYGNESSPGIYGDMMAVVKKTLSSPSVPPAIWEYSYLNANNEVGLGLNRTTVKQPDGTKLYNSYNPPSNHLSLMRSEVFSSMTDTVPLEVTDYTYTQEAAAGSGFVLAQMGDATKPVRTATVKITRGTDIYNTRYTYNTDRNAADYSYGYPVKVDTWSSLGNGTRTTSVTYLKDSDDWILGLPDTVTKNGKLFDDYDWDTKGRLVTHKQFGTTVATLNYHTSGTQAGQLYTYDNALNHRTTFEDYHRGAPRLITRDGTTFKREINDNGWVTSETNGRLFTTTYGYHASGWLERITPPSPWEPTHITYHNLGTENFYRSIRRGTKETVEWYDSMLRLTREGQKPLSGGGMASYTTKKYDPMGRQTFVSLPSFSLTPAEGTTTTYDGLGRVTGTAQNFGQMATTDIEYLSGNKVLSRDPQGNETITERSGYASPDDGNVLFIDQPEDVNTAMTYDIYGNILTARQYGNSNGIYADSTQAWKYNDSLLPCIHQVPETGYKVFKYDAAKQLEQYAEGLANISMAACPDFASQAVPTSARVSMAYDADGRLKSVNYPDTTPDVAIDYDANGNVKRNERGGVVWAYDYDNLDHLTAETLTIDGRTYDLDYHYNTMGKVEFRTLPSGRVIEFSYNGLEQLSQVKSQNKIYASGFSYHPNGLMAAMKYGNGHSFVQTLTPSQQPDRLTSQLTLVKAVDLDYDYNVSGQVTKIIDHTFIDGSRNRTMDYDGLGRLKTANGVWGAGSFKYDSLGNLRKQSLGSRVVEVSYDPTTNRATQSSDTAGALRAIGYDTRGNVTQLGALGFEYDKANQPTVVKGSSGGTYTYDGNFKRVKAAVDGKVIYNVFDAAGALVYVDEVVGGTAEVQVCFADCEKVAIVAPQKTDYISAGNLSVRLENDQPTYLHNDLLGSPVAATDAFGMVTWQEHYTPYGEKWQRAAANDDQASFTGHIADSATGLTYMQARYYDPVIGRFLSNDPVGFAPSRPDYFNRYAYVGNDPVNMVDPTGEFGVVGFGIGFIADSFAQYMTTGKVDLRQSLVSGAVGFVTGGAASLAKASMTVGGTLVATTGERIAASTFVAVSGATAGAGAHAVNTTLDGNQPTVESTAKDAVLSAAGPGKAVGDAVGAIATIVKEIAPALKNNAADVAVDFTKETSSKTMDSTLDEKLKH